MQDHISLYLAVADTSSVTLGWEVYAVFRLFLLDQNQDNYLVVQGYIIFYFWNANLDHIFQWSMFDNFDDIECL